MNNKNRIMLGVLVSILLIGILGTTFAVFNYSKNGDNNQLIVGDIYMHYKETNTLTIDNMMPSDTYDPTKYFEFTIDGKNTNTKYDIIYDVTLNYGDAPESRTERLQDEFLKFTLLEMKEGESEWTTIVDSQSYDTLASGIRVWKDTIPKNTMSEIVHTYRLYMWIDSGVLIGNVADADYSDNVWSNDVYASVKVTVTGDFTDKEIYTGPTASELVLAAADERNSTCPTKIVEDNITYISGDYGCINFNYVWYSGKMWRVTAVYPDGSMKLVTDSLMTTISYNLSYTNYNFYTDSSEYSVIYQWLNEDFLDGIYNAGGGIIDTTKYWNATAVNHYSAKPAETNMVSSSDALVGLLNTYEYYESYQNATSPKEKNGYLYNGLSWFKLNDDTSEGSDTDYEYSYGVRPAIYINSSVQFKSGTGTKSNPYIINGDKTVGKANDLVNTRIPGEYVTFSGAEGKLYRIVSIDNSLTKLLVISDGDQNFDGEYFSGYDPISELGEHGVVLTSFRAFGNENYQPSYVNSPDSTALDYMLEDYYDPSRQTIYGNYIIPNSKLAYGNYYMGEVHYGESYKLGVCTTDTSKTKNCTKADSVSRVSGILRYGELFAAYDGSNYQYLYTYANCGNDDCVSRPVWLMTPADSDQFWSIESGNSGTPDSISEFCLGGESGSDVREAVNGVAEGFCGDTFFYNKKGSFPTIYTKSTIKIVSGSGTELDPYVVS